MINFDLFYGIVTFIFNFATFLIFILFYIKLNKSDIRVFLARIFLKADRFIYAFFALWIGLIALSIGYAVSFAIAFTNPSTDIWEYTNIITFFCLVLFMFFFTGLYTYRIKFKRKEAMPVAHNMETQTANNTNQTAAQNNDQNAAQQTNGQGESKIS